MLPDGIVASLSAKKVLEDLTLWRNLPTRYPSAILLFPDIFTEAESDKLSAFADMTSEVDHDSEKRDRWHQYMPLIGDTEALDFCFSSILIPPSRFSSGAFPAWYASASEDGSRMESAYHIKRQILCELSELPGKMTATVQRAMYRANIVLHRGVDLRLLAPSVPDLLENGPPYPFCNSVGTAAVVANADGLLTMSKRNPADYNGVVFKKIAVQKSILRSYFDITVARNGSVFVMGQLISI